MLEETGTAVKHSVKTSPRKVLHGPYQPQGHTDPGTELFTHSAEERDPCMIDRAEGKGRGVGRPKGPAGCIRGCRLSGQNQQVAAGSELRWTPRSRVGLFK